MQNFVVTSLQKVTRNQSGSEEQSRSMSTIMNLFFFSSGGHVFTAIIPFVFHPYIRGLAVAPSQTLSSTSVSVGAQFMLLGIHHTPCNLTCIHLNSTAWWITRTMIMIDPGKRTWRITFEFEPRRTVRWNVYELKEKNSLYSRRLPHRQEREETHYFFT